MPTDSPQGERPAATGADPAIAELRAELRAELHALQAEVRLLKGQLLRITGEAERAPARPAVVPRPAASSPAEPVARGAATVPALAVPGATTALQAGRWLERRVGVFDRRRTDLESLVGRYGTIALGALLLLMGAGVLLSWAVQRIRFGPTARVALGAAGAAAVAAIGVRMRRHGSRPFGNILLGIALALVHVDAWGAGPSLGVVPNQVALAVAALASAALAALAWRAGEESLFVVGVGGAFLAPYVTADKRSDVVVLLAYGWVVLTAAVVAMRGRGWRVAAQLLALAGIGYTAAAILGDWGGATRATRNAPAAFAVVCALTLLVAGSGARSGWLTRVYLWLAAVALSVRSFRPEHPYDVVVLAAAATIIAYVAARAEGEEGRAAWLPTVIGAPLALLGIVLTTPEWGLTPWHAGLAAAWSAAALLAARESLEFRGAHLLVAGAASAYAAVAAIHSSGMDPETMRLLDVAVLALHAAAFGAFARRVPDPLRLVTPLLTLVVASVMAYDLLEARPAFAYTPFLTSASLAAFAAVVGWVVVTLHAHAMPPVESESGLQPVGLAGALAAAAAFLWGREELIRAVSIEMAIFLVILYFAASGVAAILAGRVFSLAAARRTGLAVAVYAALKALYQAADLERVGLRIGAYVLVGTFLLAVAFWYRAAGEGTAALATEGAAGSTSQA